MFSYTNYGRSFFSDSNSQDFIHLIECLKSGDPKGFENLVKKYSGALTHYGHVMFSNVDYDIVYNSTIDTYINIINSISTCTFTDEKSFNNWIFKIFSNKLISSLRAQNALKRGGKDKHHRFEQLSINNYDLHTDNSIELQIERTNLIKIIFEKLPLKYSMVLWYAAHGYSDEDIAKIYSQSVSSLKSLKMRAIKKARHILNRVK